MCLLDFIQQDDRVGRAADALRQLAAFFVTHVPWGRANQFRDRVLLHELRHVEANERFLRTEEKFRQATGDFGLAHTGRPEEEEAAHWTQRRLEPRAAPANGASQRRDGLILADDALVQFRLDAQQLLLLVLFDGGDADARPSRNDFFDVFARHDARGGVIQLETFAQSAQVFFFLAFFLGIETRLLEFVIGDGRFHAMRNEFHALLHFAHFFGDGGLAQLYASAGLVDQVDGFVGQKTIGDITVRKIDGITQRFVRVTDRVEFFVALAHALNYLHGLLFIRSRNFHGLEAPLQRAVFFHGLAVFARRRRADALNLTARKCGLQYISRVQRAFRRTGAHQRVQLVDEHDRILALHQFLHDGLQPFFELSAVFCASNDQGEVQGKNPLVRQERWNITISDALRQSFDDGGLAHAWFADQNRIVLGAAAQNLNDTLDFVFASDKRIQRAFRRRLRKVAAEFREQRSFLRPGRRCFLAGRACQLFPQGGKPQPALHQDFRAKTLFLAQNAEE